MKKLYLSVLIILPFTILRGQNDLFKNINTFNHEALAEKTGLIYFHFKGCPPCKRMDIEVLSSERVREYLNSNFVCFDVFGFDSLETKFRNLYGVKGDPAFLFVNNKGQVIHKIVGYYNIDQFLIECQKANTSANLHHLDSIYSTGNYNLDFFRNYVKAKERARSLDSVLITKYLKFIPDSNLLDWDYFEDIMHYGYYEGIWEQPIDSRYYKTIKHAYSSGIYEKVREEMRNRLILSLNFHLSRLDLHSPSFDSLLNELEKLETGGPILLKDLFSNGYYAYLQDRYPSFQFAYKRAKSGCGDLSPTEVFENHIKRNFDNAPELNSLAWGIYEDRYSENINRGIDIVKRAIEIDPKYGYYDTYAALLYKAGNYIEAKTIGLYAIELAKNQGKDYKETEELLTKIEIALNENKN